MSEVIPLRNKDVTPEMVLKEVLAGIGDIKEITIIAATSDKTNIYMCGSDSWMYQSSLCLSDLATKIATGGIKRP